MEPINPKFTQRTGTYAVALLAVLLGGIGCSHPPPPYGTEHGLALHGIKRQVWAVAPVLNLSGVKEVDPILQADLLFQQLQEVDGLTVIPVNRVAEAMLALRTEKIQSRQQAEMLCQALGCDGLIVATVTSYDPYDPPKMGGALQLFRRPTGRSATRPATQPASDVVQTVGMFDAQNGTVRDAVERFAHGRNDPSGPYAVKEYYVNMDRYAGFVYHVLIAELLNSPRLRQGSPVSE